MSALGSGEGVSGPTSKMSPSEKRIYPFGEIIYSPSKIRTLWINVEAILSRKFITDLDYVRQNGIKDGRK